MHERMRRSAVVLPTYPRDTEWLQQRAGMVAGYLPHLDQDLIEMSVTGVASMLARTDVQGLPSGMIHGDLFRDNVLFDGQGLTGVLDFHHAARGYLIYDLAVAANDWCADASGCLDPERTLQLLRDYHQIRPLQPLELWFFPGFALYAALAFWLSRLAVALQQSSAGRVRFKNPDEFRSIVLQQSRHPFYVDPRSLER